MKPWAKKSWFMLIVVLITTNGLVARANIENSQPPIYLHPTPEIQKDLTVKTTEVQTVQAEVKAEAPVEENPYLADDPSSFLPELSEMLNQGALERAQVSSEGLRRQAMFHSSDCLMSEFLKFQPAKKST